MIDPCIDVHVHLHPPGLAQAIERWFARERWVGAHPWDPDAVVATLRERGVKRFCFFSYAHKPGMSRSLNRWVAETAARYPEAMPFGTAHAEDPDLEGVVDEALGSLGLRGLKFHHSVQRFRPDDPRLLPIYERMEGEGRPLMLHAGTMPYRDSFTGVAFVQPVLRRFPRLRACVAHMGAFETDAFLALTAEFPHLYLDTTMALAPAAAPYVGPAGESISTEQILRHQDRILFGSDFPLPPYDYEEERRWAEARGLPCEVRRKIFHDNALAFLGGAGA